MTLTDDEARKGAERLWRTALKRELPTEPEVLTSIYAMIRGLAANIPEPETPAQRAACMLVFWTWMGDDCEA